APRRVSVAGSIHGNGVGELVAVATQVRGVDQGPRRRELGHESVRTPAAVRLQSAAGGGEVGGPRSTGDVSIAAAVHGNGFALFRVAATQVGRIAQGIARGAQLGDEGVFTARG